VADFVSRTVAQQLGSTWGGNASAFVENKPGGNTVIAVNSLLSAPKDGHTFLVTFSLTRQLPQLGLKLNFDPLKDLLPVGNLSVGQLLLLVNAKSGIKDFPSLVAFMRKRAGGATFATFGVGSVGHLVALQMGKALGVEIVPVHYTGIAPGMRALLSGEIDMFLANLDIAQQHISAGTVIPIAVTGPKRYHVAPNLPTLAEVGVPGLEFVSWIGVFAASGTPANIIGRFGEDLRSALRAPELQAKFQAAFVDPAPQSLEEFRAMVKEDDELNTRLITEHHVRLE
jgi:tripartite-type tricarboxylate transporter receptor subunit TctC